MQTGQQAHFSGKSPDGMIEGYCDVVIVQAHINAAEVHKVEGKGKRMREYNKQGHRHIRLHIVRNARGREFQAYGFQLTNGSK